MKLQNLRIMRDILPADFPDRPRWQMYERIERNLPGGLSVRLHAQLTIRVSNRVQMEVEFPINEQLDEGKR